MTTRVHIVEDQTLTRQGIRLIVDHDPFMEVVGESADGLQVLEELETSRPDLVLMDLGMPRMGGMSALREIRKRWPGTKVMVLTIDTEPARAAEALRAGARGYVLKSIPKEDLVAAIRRVAAGSIYLSPDLDADRVHMLVERDTDQAALTDRERQVFKLIAEGNTNQQIAQVLGISIKTVDSHRSNLMRKLEAHNVAQLLARGQAMGLAD